MISSVSAMSTPTSPNSNLTNRSQSIACSTQRTHLRYRAPTHLHCSTELHLQAASIHSTKSLRTTTKLSDRDSSGRNFKAENLVFVFICHVAPLYACTHLRIREVSYMSLQRARLDTKASVARWTRCGKDDSKQKLSILRRLRRVGPTWWNRYTVNISNSALRQGGASL